MNKMTRAAKAAQTAKRVADAKAAKRLRVTQNTGAWDAPSSRSLESFPVVPSELNRKTVGQIWASVAAGKIFYRTVAKTGISVFARKYAGGDFPPSLWSQALLMVRLTKGLHSVSCLYSDSGKLLAVQRRMNGKRRFVLVPKSKR